MKRRRGFSLIEVLIAIFLVAMCAAIVAVTMPISTQSRMKADNLNKAVGLAQKQIEAVRGLGYANATATQLASIGLIDSATPIGTNTYSFTNVDLAALDNPARILPSGSGRITIEQVDLDLKRIIVTINWTDRGQNRTVTLGTLIANL